MRKDSENFLETLLNTPSPSGCEQPAAKIFRDRVKDQVDELTRDVHGNSYAVLNPGAKLKFMLAGHVDEIGLMVNHIDDDGYIYPVQIGGMDTSLLIGQRVKILTKKSEVLGVVGRKAIHLMEPEDRKKAVQMDNIWIDVGAPNKKEAEKVVSVGDPMIIDVQYRRLRGDKIVSRATDDKVGAYVVAEAMRALSRKKLNITVIGVATVQEEVGLRGAITSTFNTKPDAAIAIDVDFASDHPDSDAKKTGEVKLGKGPVLHRGPTFNPVLGSDLADTAKQLKISYQVTAERKVGYTDANAIQLSRGGVATALISIPNRYMHSPVEVISLNDLDNAVKLIVGYLAKLPARKDYRP